MKKKESSKRWSRSALVVALYLSDQGPVDEVVVDRIDAGLKAIVDKYRHES